jgi:hypothetical protein
MKVDAIFRTYDGRSVDPFRDVAASLPREDENVQMLLDMGSDECEQLRFGATWVLKHWVQEGVRLDARSVGRVIGLIADPGMPPMAVVDLLQALPRLEIPSRQKKRLHRILLGYLDHSVPFLRGWAHNGLDVLACQWPEFRTEVDGHLGRASGDPAASVRARIRNRLKERKREQR